MIWPWQKNERIAELESDVRRLRYQLQDQSHKASDAARASADSAYAAREALKNIAALADRLRIMDIEASRRASEDYIEVRIRMTEHLLRAYGLDRTFQNMVAASLERKVYEVAPRGVMSV